MTILLIFIKSYLSIILAISGGALLILALGIYGIVRLSFRSKKAVPVNQVAASPRVQEKAVTAPASDISAIAGDDPMSTQLDLARAYIESGKNPLAKIILESVAEKGSVPHQDVAQHLLSTI